MKTYELKCTQCGANLVISTDKDHAFCEYCGHKLVLAAENEYEAAVQVQASKDAAKVKMHEIDKATELEQAKAKNEVDIAQGQQSTNQLFLIFAFMGFLVVLSGIMALVSIL